MNLKTILYPIYVNRISNGYEVGFVSGDVNAKTKFFEDAGVIVRPFRKKPNFEFLKPVRCTAKICEDTVSERKRYMQRLAGRQDEDSTIDISADDIEQIYFDEVDDNEKND